MSQKALEDRLIALVAGSAFTMRALSVVRELGLSSWCIGAGAIRSLVWDHLHGYETPTRLSDMDLAYFEPNDPTGQGERALEAALSKMLPECCWEAVNQASVHRWLQAQLVDQVVQPFKALEEGVGSWPELATCVGVTLSDADNIQVIAPHGLNDLFAMIVRRNPACVSKEAFSKRVSAKRWDLRWPGVKIDRSALTL